MGELTRMVCHLAAVVAVISTTLVVCSSTEDDTPAHQHWDYIVVGAGPAGLQMGYYLKQAGRDYMVFEQGNNSGNFFNTYPRHDKLISINKRHTGKLNKEFNMRHDWNSLLSHDESLLMKYYSKQLFPDRRDYLRYLDDFQKKLDIKVQFNSKIMGIVPTKDDRQRFVMRDQHGEIYTCSYLIIATGISKPNIPQFSGVEFTEGYEDMSLNPEDYEGKTVLILGRGNTAFEVADSIYGHTNLVHMLSRSRVRLSWETHYVGDLRAINNGLLDTYQLKSLDGIAEAPVDHIHIIKDEDGRLWVSDADRVQEDGRMPTFDFDNFAFRDSYDHIIRCLGWEFDDSLFMNSTSVSRAKGKKKKFPRIYTDYQSVDFKHLYFAGTNTHSLDFRKSAGGFIHGFRYTVKALHRTLEWKNHGVKWPSTVNSIDQLLPRIIKRINEASGIYQMFGVLGDVIAIRKGGLEFEYFEAFPINLIHRFESYTGRQVDSVFVVVMEYGYDFSGPGKDIFREDRATGEPSDAHESNFLHPVFYYYKSLPGAKEMVGRKDKSILPHPDNIHHLVEDFLTDFTAPTSHILPLRRFIENSLELDTRQAFAEDCLRVMLTHTSVPFACQDYVTSGHGLYGGFDALQHLESKDLLL